MLVMDIDRREEKGGAARRETAESKSRVMGSWTPLAGDALLDRLRVTGRPRPLADPDRAARLRETIERGLAQGTVANQGGRRDQSPSPTPLVITKDRLTRALSPGVHHDAIGFGVQPPTTPMACGALIDVLFRQLVTIGSIGDPMTDGLAALALDDRQAHLIAWIDSLSGTERGTLAAEVDRQSIALVNRWPTLDPAWLPRTQLPIRVDVAAGAVELSGRVDLAIGRPGLNVASVAIVEVKSGTRRPEHRKDLHFYALIETLRSPAPPFVVATYYTRTGELDIDPVSDELLAAAARRTVAGARALGQVAEGATPSRLPDQQCGKSAVLPGCRPGRQRVAADIGGYRR